MCLPGIGIRKLILKGTIKLKKANSETKKQVSELNKRYFLCIILTISNNL